MLFQLKSGWAYACCVAFLRILQMQLIFSGPSTVLAPSPATVQQINELRRYQEIAQFWRQRWIRMAETLTCTHLTFKLRKHITIPSTDDMSCDVACYLEATEFRSIDFVLQLIDHQVFSFTCLRTSDICLNVASTDLTVTPHFNPLTPYSRLERLQRTIRAATDLSDSLCMNQFSSIRNILVPNGKGYSWIALPEKLCKIFKLIRQALGEPTTSGQGLGRQCVCHAIIHYPSVLSTSQDVHNMHVPRGYQSVFDRCDPFSIALTTTRDGWWFHSMSATFPQFPCSWTTRCPDPSFLDPLATFSNPWPED